MSKVFLNKTKNVKVNRFLFFLLLATIFWILTKFSREFTATMSAKIEYVKMPDTVTLAKNNLKNITFDLTANGFEILFYKFKRPTIEITVEDYYTSENSEFKISRAELTSLIYANFNKNFNIKNVSVEELDVRLDPIVIKKVPVIARAELTYKDGFKPIDSMQIVPDSVTLSGPSGSLEDIDTIETAQFAIKNIEEDIVKTVNVVNPSSEIKSIKPDKVEILLTVAEFSQGRFTLPVEVINLPPNVDIKMLQQSVEVSFDVPVSDFSEINKDSFRVVCDYSQRENDENFMLPFLEKKPYNARNVIFSPKKIDFFILK